MKKLTIAFIVLFATVVLTSCTEIEDTNGDDTSLCQITQEDLISNSANWSSNKSSTKTKKTSSGYIPNNYYTVEFSEEIDHDYLSFKCGSASGVSTMVGVKLDVGEEAKITVESSIDSGNLAVIVMEKGESNTLLYQFANDSEDSYIITAQEDAVYYVRVGAESFGGKVIITREYLE